MIFSLLSVLSIFLTPYGFKIVELAKRISFTNAFHLNYISEWLPAYYLPINYYLLIYGALIVIGVICFVLMGLSGLPAFLAAMSVVLSNVSDVWWFLHDYVDDQCTDGILMIYWQVVHSPYLDLQPLILEGESQFTEIYSWVEIDNEWQPNPDHWHTLL